MNPRSLYSAGYILKMSVKSASIFKKCRLEHAQHSLITMKIQKYATRMLICFATDFHDSTISVTCHFYCVKGVYCID